MSGWMGTLNDWFTDEAFTAYTVANGKLADGDEIRIVGRAFEFESARMADDEFDELDAKMDI